MKYVEVNEEAENADMISQIVEKHEILDLGLGMVEEDGKQIVK